MAYLPLRNYKYDSGPHRIQSGPDHEGYIVVSSGVHPIGADNGIIVDGAPLSGVVGPSQRWGYDANWRYVPTSSPAVSGRLTLTRRQPSGTLGSYTYTRVSTPSNIAGVKVVSSVESDIGFRNLNKRKSVYYGGACPDNQNYSPFNTPEGNTAAEGKTGGGVTHQLYESPLLTNVLGSQGTSNRSEWQYSSPVYCAVFTEAVRSETPGLMSTIVRSTYRGGSLSYLANYGNVVLGAQQFSGGGEGGGGEEVYEEEVDGGFDEWEEETFAIPRIMPVVGFGQLQINYSVIVNKSISSELDVDEPSFALVDGFVTQDNIEIRVFRVRELGVEAKVGSGTLTPKTYPFVGDTNWSTYLDGVSFGIDVNYGFDFDIDLFNVTEYASSVTLSTGLACFNLAFLVCNDPPFTGQTYGQAIPGYSTPVTANFSYGPVNRGSATVNIIDNYYYEYPLVPPLPPPWFGTYQTDYAAYYSTAVIFSASRTKTITLNPVSSIKVSLIRTSTNRFRLRTSEQARGGRMMLEYSAYEEDGFSRGFVGPTIVTIPPNEQEVYFDVIPGDFTSYTVVLVNCFGIYGVMDAQFWPLEPDPVDYFAHGPDAPEEP